MEWLAKGSVPSKELMITITICFESTLLSLHFEDLKGLRGDGGNIDNII